MLRAMEYAERKKKREMEEKYCKEAAAAAAAEDISREKKGKSSSSNTDKIIIIPDEVIFDILLRMPFEQIVKFKYVCKRWHRMISSDPIFVDRFIEPIRINNSSKNYVGIITYFPNLFFSMHETVSGPSRRGEPEVLKLEHKHLFTTPSLDFYERSLMDLIPIMLRSVNGLVCLISTDDHLNYICNPTTREFRSFPNCHHLLPLQGRHRGYGFGYSHPSSSSSSSSSSRDPVYKVIQMSSTCSLYNPTDGDPNPIQCVIHTLGSKSWRTIKSPNYPLVNDSVFVDGVMYWLVQTKVVGLVKIVSFDVGDEEFGELLPPGINSNNRRWSILMQLVELNGCLCLVDWIIRNGDVMELHIWRMLKQVDMAANNTMKSNSESWVREYQISIRDEVPNLLQLMQIRNGEILFRWADSGFYSYDIKRRTMKSVSPKGYPYSSMQATVYEPSLVSPLPASNLV